MLSILGQITDLNYSSAPGIFGFIGVTSAIVFSNMGSAYGTAKAGVGIASVGIMKPDILVKAMIPVVMASILGIYGLIMCIIILQKIKETGYTFDQSMGHMAAGLSCGLSALAAGYSIGEVGDQGVRSNAREPQVFVGMILILIFAEAIALFGLIVAILLS